MDYNKIDKKIEKDIKEIVKFNNDEEKIEFEATMIHLDIIDEIIGLMEECNMNYTELAELLDVSKSYISKLFAGDRLINMKMLAKIQRIFNVSLSTNFRKDIEEYAEEIHIENEQFNNIYSIDDKKGEGDYNEQIDNIDEGKYKKVG